MMELDKPLTLGKLREIVNNDLSELSDDLPIKMVMDTREDNVYYEFSIAESPIVDIRIIKKNISFYNY